MTPKERDALAERMADALLDHEDRSSDRHLDMGRRLDQVELLLDRIIANQGAGLLGVAERTMTRITSTTAGSVALCALLAILTLTGAAVWLGAPEVLSILAGRVQIGPTSDMPHSPPTPPEVPHVP